MQHLVLLYLLLALLAGSSALTVLGLLLKKRRETALRCFALAFACFTVAVATNLARLYLALNLGDETGFGAYIAMALGMPFAILMQAFLVLAANEAAKPPFRQAANAAALALAGLELILSFTPLFASYDRAKGLLGLGPFFPAINSGGAVFVAYAAIVVLAFRRGIADRGLRRLLVAFACLSLAFMLALGAAELAVPVGAGPAIATGRLPLALFALPLYYDLIAAAVVAAGLRVLSRPPARATAFGDIDLDAWARGIGVSEREKEVVRLIARGLGNKEIAAELGISQRTVGNHVSSIFRKAGVASRFELVASLGNQARQAPLGTNTQSIG